MCLSRIAESILWAALGGVCLLAPWLARAAPDETSITIYSSAAPGTAVQFYRPAGDHGAGGGQPVPGFAVISQDRMASLASGHTQLRITDVAALIDPTTVQFVSLSDPEDTRVLEQNFQFDLVSIQKLLSRYIDKMVTVQATEGTQSVAITGTLLSAGDGLVLRAADGQIHAVRQYSNLRFADLPGGLITRPTLVWDIQARKGGDHKVRLSYQTGGVTWWTDYNLTFTPGANANSGFIDVGAWVSIINESGASYDDARLKLIAGDVRRVQPAPLARGMAAPSARMAGESGEEGFAEKAFFEYHLYTLGRRVSLPDNSTKQLELFDAARHVPARKILVYFGAAGLYFGGGLNTERNYGATSNTKVDVYLEFRNEEKFGLGVPLPRGLMRVSQLDPADHALEFIGEDAIDHTPKNERVLVKLGSSFDVVGERRQVDFSVDTKAKWMEEEFEIKLRNHKTESVEVLVKEALYRGSNWTVKSSSSNYEKTDARNIYFPVTVPPDGEQTIRYRVRYTW